MAKRQAIILLVVVLAVSLASFTLGVVVGRRGAERDMAHKMSQTERVLVAESPVEKILPIEKNDRKKDLDVVATEPVEEVTKLTFYDNLAKETAPLGSGINLAPVKAPAVNEDAVKPPIDLPAQPIVVKKEEAAKTAPIVEKIAAVVEESDSVSSTASATLLKAAAQGSHAVQIGSFNSAGDALALKQKMLDKDYPAFVVEADLGKKGLWYRVRIGPYGDSEKAKQAQLVLEEKEKIKGFVSRR
jgi:cell division septation protein DedD